MVGQWVKILGQITRAWDQVLDHHQVRAVHMDQTIKFLELVIVQIWALMGKIPKHSFVTCLRHRNLQNIQIQILQIFCYDFFA